MDSFQSSEVPSPVQPKRSKKTLFIIGCGGLLGICVILAIIGSLISNNEDDEPTVAAIVGQSSAVAGDESTNSTSTSEQSTPNTVADIPLTPTQERVEPTATLANEPTPTEEPEPTATAISEQVGTGRSNPVPLGQTATTDDWEIQVLEVVRGNDAMQRLIDANQFNDAPPPGMEYVLVNVRVKYLGNETEAQGVDFSWFRATGDARVKHSWASVVEPEPELDAELFPGGEATGWTTVLARQDETNLVLIFEPLLSVVEGDELFLALTDGAQIQPLTERLAPENDLGFDRNSPVALGEHVVGDTWEIWVIESVRGDEALQRVKEANMFNEDPAPGMEYVLVHVSVRNVKADSGSDRIDEFSFKLTGDAARVYDNPIVVDPEPRFDFDIYAGGEASGWITLQAAEGEQGLKLVYEPAFSFTSKSRYMNIQ